VDANLSTDYSMNQSRHNHADIPLSNFGFGINNLSTHTCPLSLAEWRAGARNDFSDSYERDILPLFMVKKEVFEWIRI